MQKFSIACPPLINNPFKAPTPVETITAVGVAKPKAQGQATQSTETAVWKAKEIDLWLKNCTYIKKNNTI